MKRHLLVVTAIMTPLVLLCGAMVSWGGTTSRAGTAVSPEAASFFETRIRPVLHDRCSSCHGDAVQISNLRLDSREHLLKGGKGGPVIVPGEPDKSTLIQAVRYAGARKMPPTGKLPDDQIAALVEWVKMGAPWPDAAAARSAAAGDASQRWSFQPLNRPALPAVKRAGWAKNPIDLFILKEMEARKLAPNSYADRRALIRRASLDLTGLPPTPEEVDAFEDDRSPDAWRRIINRLLESPHYGERWGRHWLDLARFAESHGYEQDYDRPYAYHFRDFVIRALNEDMPYDQFVRWQLAGDESDPENPMALMATGFLAAGTHATQITKNQVEKERYDELDDMLATTGTVMLGLTFGCARCHNHKFDPIPQLDYYRMVSTFTTTVRSDMEVNMDPDGYRKARAAFEKEHAPLVAAVTEYERYRLPERLEAWLKSDARNLPAPVWLTPDVVSAKSQGGATLRPLPDGSYLAEGKLPDTDSYTMVAHTFLTGIRSIRLEGLTHPALVKGGPGRAGNGNFALTDFRVTATPLEQSEPAKPIDLKLVSPRATFEQANLPIRAAIDGDAKSGWAVDPQIGKNHAAIFNLEKPAGYQGGTILTFTLKFENNTGHSLGRPRIALTTELNAAFEAPTQPETIQALLGEFLGHPTSGTSASGVRLTDSERLARILRWYATQDPEWQSLNAQVENHNAKEPKPPIQKVLISSEGVPAVRTHTQGGDFLENTHFLRRGDPNQKEFVATQSFLQVLMRNPEREKRWIVDPPQGWRTSYRRTSFANWITDVDRGAGHLLARVIVNRLWHYHFGRGIVTTPSDFGKQGASPTHPELLDWLADELIQSGWKLKHIHRLIMTSATYMQSSGIDAAKATIDPDNRWWWRFPRRRLEGEIIRDSMLAVSGLLDPAMYGPGTLDESMRRRSIYFFVKRSRLIPSMALFDAPNALLPLPVRSSTTIAPQALMLLNNKHVRQCAEALARRVRSESDDPPEVAIQRAYALTLGRSPDNNELNDARTFIEQQAASYKSAGKDAGTAGASALADFCQVLFGLNEFVYVE